MTQPVTETYRDRFEWDAQFCAAGCRVRGFCHLLYFNTKTCWSSSHSTAGYPLRSN